MGLFRVLICAVATLCLSGCISEEKYNEMVRAFAPDEVHTEAERITVFVITRDVEGIRSVFHPDGLSDSFEEEVSALWEYIPEGEAVERNLAGLAQSTLKTIRGIDRTDYTFVYQYEFTEGWMRMKLVLREENATLKLVNLHLAKLNEDLRVLHKFDVAKADSTRIIMLITMIITVSFIVFTFVKTFKIRKQLLKPKRWLFFILIGIGGYSINWTTGAEIYNLFSFGFLGGGFVSDGPYSPWKITAYLPLGAILFWTFKKTGKLGLKPVDSAEPTDA